VIKWYTKLLVYADNVHILGRSVHNIKKNTQVLVVASQEIGLKVTAVKTEEKIQLGRPRHRWEYNIKTDLQEVGWGAWPT
jgi:hypothetical protein